MRVDYIGHHDFGKGINCEDFIYEALEKFPKLNSVDASIVLTDVYEQSYGITRSQDNNKNRPLASVALNEGEKVSDHLKLGASVELYMDKAVKDNTGLTLLEFLELSRPVLETIIKACDKRNESKSGEMSKLEESLKNIK